MTLLNTGKLIHSKLGGGGKCESTAEQQTVLDAIQDFVDNV